MRTGRWWGCTRASLVLPTSLLTLTQGFDEYMNIVLDETDELDMKRKTKTPLGRILLKGDNVTCLMQAPG